ncbi:MAG: hypothetical protein WC099_02320 [Candidatus Paceibacterota bacterium]
MKRDWILIILWPIVASVISIIFKTNFFISTVLFYIVPSIYISIRHSAFIKKTLIVSAVTLPMLLVVDYIAVKTGTWFFPTSVFSERLFGTTVLEVVLWLFSYVYTVIIFYEYFLEHTCKNYFTNRKLKYVFIGFSLLFLVFLLSLLATGSFVHIPYFYLVFGLVFGLIPIGFTLAKHPKLLTKFVSVTAYFSLSSFLWEIVALRLGQWTFPGSSFIGWVEITNVRFPFEEFLVWIVLGAASILAWYELFDDDGN